MCDEKMPAILKSRQRAFQAEEGRGKGLLLWEFTGGRRSRWPEYQEHRRVVGDEVREERRGQVM